MSCPLSPSTGESPGGPVPGNTSGDSSSRVRGYELPTHNWRHTLIYGVVFWAVVAAAWLAVPTGHPFQLGVTLSGLFAAPLLPVALLCDYRQAREFGTCEPGLRAYLSNLARDIKTAGTGQSALGDERREFLSC
ncbi:hypothetical protein BVU17_12330 [Haloarcula taiwanensis]|uniref:Uncharacterized protein n=1 Tax=Haloarcula taiwanensis TaxID=1932004 RepID=A0A2H5A0Q9_9EURY|nr:MULTISPECIES: hypothetical protein [unclassified Haloarcula]AUG48270.1 hypothetical protein BVU17_12330 [Haloarcula taiwanensis]RLM39627.1 hypothetical protein DVK01_03440 [Haloarcula sp. Atlit-120R]RLM47602.1 hypothetical protein DVK00_03595 [Haloarcula sp. Atlit-47R]